MRGLRRKRTPILQLRRWRPMTNGWRQCCIFVFSLYSSLRIYSLKSLMINPWRYGNAWHLWAAKFPSWRRKLASRSRTIRCRSTHLAGRCGGRIWGWIFWMTQKTDGLSLSLSLSPSHYIFFACMYVYIYIYKYTYMVYIWLLYQVVMVLLFCSCFVCFMWILKWYSCSSARMKLIESSATLASSWSRSRARGPGTSRTGCLQRLSCT